MNLPGRAGAHWFAGNGNRAAFRVERQGKLRRAVNAGVRAVRLRAEMILHADPPDALGDLAAVFFRRVARARKPSAVLFQKLREFLLEKREELLLRRRHQKQRAADE